MANEQDRADYEFMLAAGAENSRYNRMMEHQRAQAAAMRQNAQMPNGQMVSGHYVPPSWTQGLSSLMNAVGSRYMDNKALESGRGLDDSMRSQNNTILQALLRNRTAAPQAPQRQTVNAQSGLPALSAEEVYQMPTSLQFTPQPTPQQAYPERTNYFGGE